MAAPERLGHVRLPGDASGPELEFPERLVEPSAWLGHVPFAMWLVGALKPRMIVELGVHTGNSYCAFLQAVRMLGLDTRCFGIDHWQGDEHAGHYGEEIYREFCSYHDAQYGAFSTLLRSTFEEARSYFSDGSIDLLHIDGFHSYEAVSADFTTWLPKVSSRGVALFHDINVRERGFGIWQFWDEISSRYPHFEFTHSHGLGIAYLGSESMTRPLKALFATKPDAERERVRSYFVRLGTSVFERRVTQRLSADIDAANERVTMLAGELTAVRSELTYGGGLAAAQGQAREQVAVLEAELAAARSELTKANTDAGALAAAHGQAREQVAVLEAELAAVRSELAKANMDARALVAHKQARQQVVSLKEEMEASQSDLARERANAKSFLAAQEHAQGEIAELQAKLRAALCEAAQANSNVEVFASELAGVRLELSTTKANADTLATELTAKLHTVTLQVQMQKSLARRHIAVTCRVQRELLATNIDKCSYQRQLQQILQSKTWRWTEPVRQVVIMLRRLLLSDRQTRTVQEQLFRRHDAP